MTGKRTEEDLRIPTTPEKLAKAVLRNRLPLPPRRPKPLKDSLPPPQERG